MNAAVKMLDAPVHLPHDNDDRGRYERCIKASKRVRWDIDTDVIRGRHFDFNRKFLPDGLTKAPTLAFLSDHEQRLLSQVQGRTYANMFGMVERFIGAKALELACAHGLGDQLILEGLVRFSDEEIKHQELFRRIEAMLAARMPSGYAFFAEANEVARQVLRKSNWAVLALTYHIELFTQSHYRESIEHEFALSDLYRDVLRFHWMEECQHVAMDEIEWRREDRSLSASEREEGIDEFIELMSLLDGTLKAQAAGDAAYFLRMCERDFAPVEQISIRRTMLQAYRWQYIGSGFQHPRFKEMLNALLSSTQMQRIEEALGSVCGSVAV